MKTPFIILSLISLLFLASSCPKNDNKPVTYTPTLPPITQSGANTFGFLLNGEVWLPGGPAGMTVLSSQYYNGEILLGASRYNSSEGINQTLSFAHKSVYKTGTYYFKYAEFGGAPEAEYTDFVTNCDYKSDDPDSLNFYVTITKIDTINRIISGTFNFLFVPPGNGCDTIKITQGRFDMKYEY